MSLSESAKTAIYNAARTQFFENGYDKTTLSSISKVSKTNTAMISYYFESKEALALEIFNEFMVAEKTLTIHLLKKITPNNDLMFITATEIRVINRILQSSLKFSRFMNELNNTNFYLKNKHATTGFFFNLNKKYHLNLSEDYVKSIAVTNHAINASLHAARLNGLIDCTNDFISRTVFTHFAKLMSFDDSFIKATLENSLNAFDRIDIWVEEDFKLRHENLYD